MYESASEFESIRTCRKTWMKPYHPYVEATWTMAGGWEKVTGLAAQKQPDNLQLNEFVSVQV